MDLTATFPGSSVVATTTAWGNADPLDVVLNRISASTDAQMVELAVGARPITDPDGALDAHRHRFTYIGHHTLPLGKGMNLRPTSNSVEAIVAACVRFGLTRYSAHPPSVNRATTAGFHRWAAAYHDALGAVGVSFAVETMYVPRTASEARSTGGHHLSDPHQVADFCAFASQLGWAAPLVVDLSHLHIGWRGGQWASRDITDLLYSGVYRELHVSENDGRTDAHRPLTAAHTVAGWLDAAKAEIVVDEGRQHRRQPVPSGPTALTVTPL